jgi:hypothetical protein
VAYPIDGSWRGASGGAHCRIGDLSLGGCFIHTPALPAAGESTEIIMIIGEDRLRFTATVILVDAGMGFSVAFDWLTLDQRNQIQQILDALTTKG